MAKIEIPSMSDDVEVVEIPFYRQLWEVPSRLRCPLIGTCLNAEEHKRVLKKSGFRIKGLKLHKIHSIIMAHLHERNSVSVKANNHLNSKYRKAIETYGELDEIDLQREWIKSLETGEFDALFFLACIRRDLSDEFLEEAFGEIHMLSHAGVHAVGAMKREIKTQAITNQSFSDRIKKLKQANRELVKELEKSQKSVAADRNTTNKTIECDQSRDAEEMKRLRDEICRLKAKNDRLNTELGQSSKSQESLKSQLNDSKELIRHLQGDVEDLISHFSLLSDINSTTPAEEENNPDLECKRILIVGGMTKLKHLYQHVIEANGGQFEYHDGCMKKGNQNLDAKVVRSDLIICPVNCNSHNACNRVKKLCQKHKKPLKILSNASVSSISAALQTTKTAINAQYL